MKKKHLWRIIVTINARGENILEYATFKGTLKEAMVFALVGVAQCFSSLKDYEEDYDDPKEAKKDYEKDLKEQLSMFEKQTSWLWFYSDETEASLVKC